MFRFNFDFPPLRESDKEKIKVSLSITAIILSLISLFVFFTQPRLVKIVQQQPQTQTAQYCGINGTPVINIVPMAKILSPSKIAYQDMLYQFTEARENISLPKNITEKQAELLIYAYNVAKADGFKDPSVLQGIIWQESKAGGLKGHDVAGDEYGLPVGKRYYGVGQIKVSAARDVFKMFPKEFPNFNEKTEDEEIIAHLIMDDKFNIRVAGRYLYIVGHRSTTGRARPTNFAITAYNQGIGGAMKLDWNDWHYTVSVNKHRRKIMRPFNEANSDYLN